MNPIKKTPHTKDPNLLQELMFRFFPYWPLLIFFTLICVIGAMAYLYVAKPTYEATATLLVKDENKGHDDSRIKESLNIFNSKKIVENEIEVIRSRTIMKEVVKTLGLYAPIYRVGRIRTTSAYANSPIKVEVKDPEKIIEKENIYFTYDRAKQIVTVDQHGYPLNQWVKTNYGELRFIINKKEKIERVDPMYFSLIPSKKVVTGLIKNFNVTPASKLSSVVTLQFLDESSERAEDIVNEIINAYNLAAINDKNALADNTLHFVDERLKFVEIELDTVEKQIQMYRSQEGAINLSEQSSLFLKSVGDNDQRVALIEMQVAVLDQVQKYINDGKTKASIVPSTLGVDDPVLSQLLQRLYNAEIEYDKLKSTTAENNPILVSLRNEIQRLRPNILENIRIQRINLKASRGKLNETNKTYTDSLQTIPEKERKLLEISRQQNIINNVYNFLLLKREETALSYAATMPDSRILDVAESTIKPVSPKKIIAFPAALFIALMLTIAVVVFKDYTGNKILFRSELDRLTDLPVVAEVATAKTTKGYIAIDSNYDNLSQQFLQLPASLGLFNKDTNNKKILFTSSIQGEGKTYLSTNLALTLASSGKKVVLIDFDLKNPALSLAFNLTTGPGVSEFLVNEIEVFDIIKTSSYTNLHLIGAGEVTNSTLVPTKDRLEKLFSFLEQSFDFIIIDTSTIDLTDALILSQYSDITMYVVRHAFTPRTVLQLLDKKIRFNSRSNIGIVFNGVNSRGLIKYHNYGYGYGLGFGSKKISKTGQTKKKKDLSKQVMNS